MIRSSFDLGTSSSRNVEQFYGNAAYIPYCTVALAYEYLVS